MGNEPSQEDTKLSSEQLKAIQHNPHKPPASYAVPSKHPELSNQIIEALTELQSRPLSTFSNIQTKKNLWAQPYLCFHLLKMQGSYYEGEWKNGKQHGHGKLYTRSGVYFQGDFYHGVASCYDGFMVFPDGSTYRGSFENNSFNGQGKFTYKSRPLSIGSSAAAQVQNQLIQKSFYEGQWLNNLPHGMGNEVFEDGSNYVGNFEKGKKSGEGVFTWSNGKVYKGNFANGEMHGKGRLFIADSKKGEDSPVASFQGNFVNGFKEIEGSNQSSSNRGFIKTPYGTYNGTLRYGELNDLQGKFTWNDGKIYEGGFELGELHGQGTVTFPKFKKSHSGEWQLLLPKEYHVIKGEWNRGENVHISSITSQQ